MTILLNRRLNGRPFLINPASGSAGNSGTTVSQAFSIQNFAASVSPGFHKCGVWFKKGDVPSGSIPQLGSGSAQFYAVRTWSDGSLKLARMLLRDTAWAASESRSYTMRAATGVLPSGSTAVAGDSSLVTALSGHDIKIGFANVTQFDGTNTAPHGSSSFTASLATHAATPTRWTTLTTGPIADVWQGWGMATDNASGVADAHLKVNWYVTRWKNTDGSTAGIQVGAVMALDWWSVSGKFRLNYDAALLDGATSIVSYTGVQHPYASQWLLAVQTGNNAGAAPWVTGTQPTLFTSFDRAYLISTGLCPPINGANPPAAVAPPAYVPCGAMEHRANIDGTGEYLGRGVIPTMDADFFKRLDPQALARARVNALAGLGVPYHYRSNRQRQRPGDAAPDTANTPIALIMRPKAASYSDFTAQGMPVAVDSYYDGRSQGGAQDGVAYPLGGTGAWNTSGDSSHAVSYCYFMALVTGDEWLLEAQLDLASNLAHQSIYGYNNFRQLMLTGQPQQAAATAPSTDTSYWSGLCGQWLADNIRAMGWAQLILGHACGLVSADHVAFDYFQALLAHNGDYIAGSLNNMPADYVLAGAYYPPSELGLNSISIPWMTAIQCTCAYANYLMTEDPRWKRLGDHTFNWTGRNAANGRFYAFDQYRTVDRLKNTSWSTTNKLLPAEQQPFVQVTPNLTATNGVFTMGSVYWNAVNQPPPPFTNGDMVVFTSETQSNGRGTIPAGAVEGQVGYIRDVTNPQATSGNVYAAPTPPLTTFTIAATPSGPPLTWSSDTNGVNLAWRPQSAANYTTAQAYPYIPNWINYLPFHLSAVMMARQAGNPAATQSMRDQMLAFVVPMGPSTYSPYDMVAA